MSLSSPVLKNPAQHIFQWAGKTGNLSWYDKENKENIVVDLPFEFIVLDELATISGFSRPLETYFWANEVRNTKKEMLFVRTPKGPFEANLYENLTETRSKGGKYTKSVYIAHKLNGEWVIGCLRLPVSSALSAWIEFSKVNHTDQGKIVMARGGEQQSPVGSYYPPKFTLTKWAHEEFEIAVDLDRELQKYLTLYFAAKQVDEDAHGTEGMDDIGTATPEQQSEFERLKEKQKRERAEIADKLGLDPDEPVNLDDIPF